MNWLIIFLLITFPLGQLTRMQIAPGVQIYFHDIILPFLFFTMVTRGYKNKFKDPQALTKPIIIFSATMAISLVIAALRINLYQVFIGSLYFIRWLLYAGVYFYLVTLNKSKQKLAIFNRKVTFTDALLLAGVSFAFFGLLQYFFLPDTRALKLLGWDDHYFRLVGTLLDPGFSGILLALTTLLALGSKQTKTIKAIAVGLPVIALLLTYSRASYLAFIFGLLVMVALKKKLKKGIVVVLLFLGVLFFLPQASSEGTNLMRLYSLFDRIKTWDHATKIIKDHPLFGVGFNLLRFTKQEYGFVGEDWQTSHSASGIENSYLFILATTGFIGFLAFLWLIYSMLKHQWKKNKVLSEKNIVVISSIAAVSTHAMFNNTWFYPWVMLWMWWLLAQSEVSYSS